MKLSKEEIGLLYLLVSEEIMTSRYLMSNATVKEQLAGLLEKLGKEGKK